MFLGSIVCILLKLFKVPVDPFHNKSKPLPWAALLAAFVKGFAGFHATFKGKVSKFPHGNISIVTLGCLRFTLDLWAPMIKDVKQLGCPEKKTLDLIKKTWFLIKKMKNGKELLVQYMSQNKCCNINNYSIPYDLVPEINDLVSKIIRFCLFDLQILPTMGEPMWNMVQTHFPQFEIEGTSISFFFCV